MPTPPSRRALLQAVWTTPVVTALAAAPLASASPTPLYLISIETNDKLETGYYFQSDEVPAALWFTRPTRRQQDPVTGTWISVEPPATTADAFGYRLNPPRAGFVVLGISNWSEDSSSNFFILTFTYEGPATPWRSILTIFSPDSTGSVDTNYNIEPFNGPGV